MSNVKLNIASTPAGTARLNVVTKKPTPAVPPGSPDESEREVHDDVSKPGRCQPSRSPKSPPSFRMPRTLSGKLNGSSGQQRAREYRD